MVYLVIIFHQFIIRFFVQRLRISDQAEHFCIVMHACNQSGHQRFQRCKLRIQQHVTEAVLPEMLRPLTQLCRTHFRKHPPPVWSPELTREPHHKRQLPVQDFSGVVVSFSLPLSSSCNAGKRILLSDRVISAPRPSAS